jgi:hypothetical protein
MLILNCINLEGAFTYLTSYKETKQRGDYKRHPLLLRMRNYTTLEQDNT